MAPDYSAERNDSFYDWIKPENILSHQMVSRFLFVATVDACRVGMYSYPFAIPIYEKLGFVSMGGLQEKSGITYQHMVMKP